MENQKMSLFILFPLSYHPFYKVRNIFKNLWGGRSGGAAVGRLPCVRLSRMDHGSIPSLPYGPPCQERFLSTKSEVIPESPGVPPKQTKKEFVGTTYFSS